MSEGAAGSTGKQQTTDAGVGAAVTSTPAGTDAAPVKLDPKHATEASGVRGDNPATAGPGPTAVHSKTPENAPGHLNPSAPEDSNVTPGSTPEK